MDPEIKSQSIEQLLRFLKNFIDKFPSYSLTIQFSSGKWRAAIDGVADIKEQYLKDALGWLAMNVKKKKLEAITRYK